MRFNWSSLRWILVFVGLAIIFAVIAFGAGRAPSSRSETPPSSPGPAIGHLGGQAVSIPRTHSHFLEYDEQLAAGKASVKPPAKTHASPIRGFLFLVRYPDMAPMSPFDKTRHLMSDTSATLRVLVNSNSDYGGDGVASALLESAPRRLGWKMIKSSEPVVGLEEFRPVREGAGAPPQPIGTDFRDQNVYIHRDQSGQVDTIIQCHNTVHQSTPCQMTFALPSLRTTLAVSFRKDFLAHWRQIKQSVTDVLGSFRTAP